MPKDQSWKHINQTQTANSTLVELQVAIRFMPDLVQPASEQAPETQALR